MNARDQVWVRVQAALDAGRDPLLDVDVQAALLDDAEALQRVVRLRATKRSFPPTSTAD